MTLLPPSRAHGLLQPDSGAGQFDLSTGQLDPGAGGLAQGQRQVRNRVGGTLIGQAHICRRLGITVQTWRRWRQAGLAPVPVLEKPRPRWRVVDIERLESGEVVIPGRRSFLGAARRHVARVSVSG
jgi:hypothetical protein